jgi:ABC-type phosphate/phosphonate transport system substrate-binding protein
MRRQIEAVFLGMNTDPKGKETLRHLGIDAFVRPNPRAYDTIEVMMRATGVR